MDSYIAVIAERNAAVRERNMVIAEIKQAVADRDMAILQRDAAVSDRDHARMQRDNVLAQLQLKSNSVNASSLIQHPSESGVSVSQGPKPIRQVQQRRQCQYTPNYSEVAFNPREVPFGDVLQQPPAASKTTAPKTAKSKKGKRVVKDMKKAYPTKALKPVKKVGNKAVRVPPNQFSVGIPLIISERIGNDGNRERQGKFKGGLSLNDLGLDEVNLPVPFCTCTGKRQSCYKWGKGGWQSACCTTTLSQYPLPQMPNKRHSRMGGRKMSGGAFTKLIARLASEGHDITVPIDLRGHWARHGTNRYITIK